MAIQNLRSSQAHRRAIPTLLSAGQICINTNEASPGVFFKDSNGDLVKVGPVHVGTSAPNSSPDSLGAGSLVTGTVYQILTVGSSDFTAVGASANTVGTIFTATGTTTGTGTVSTGVQGNEKGEMWLDTTGGAYDLKIYDGSAWRSQAGEFVNVTGDNMTGNLTLGTNKVVLNATSGAADFASYVESDLFSVSRSAVANKDNYTSKLSTADTGKHFNAKDTGGTTVASINANGSGYFASNFGIGTTSPGDLNGNADDLVVGSGSGNRGISVYSGTSNTGNIYFADGTSGNAPLRGGVSYNHSDDSLKLLVNASERLRIDSSGNVAIGTTAVGSSAKLEVRSTTGAINSATLRVNGGLTTSGAANTGSTLLFAGHIGTGERDFASVFAGKENGTSGNNDAYLAFGTRSGSAAVAERMRIDSSGNVGIGSSSPGVPLDIAANNSTANLRITDNTNGARIKLVAASAQFDLYNTGGAGYIGTPTNSDILIATNNTERMRIDSSGRLGFGASNNSSYDSSAQNVLIASDGNTGITIRSGGSSHFALIHFADGTTGTAQQRAGRILYQHDGNNMSFHTDNTERLRIDGSGNILFGKTSQNLATVGFQHRGDAIGLVQITRDSGEPLQLNRLTNDGKLIEFRQDTTAIGSISVQGSDLGIDVNGSERLRIDSSGRLLVGTSSSVGDDNNLQVVGSTADASAATFWRSSSDTGNPSINFVKTRGSVASPSIVSSGDTLGHIRFNGHDGTDHNSRAAEIKAVVDGTPGSGDMPGRLVFSTTADGASVPTERMRIDNTGKTKFTPSSSSISTFEVQQGTTNTDSIRLQAGGTTNTYLETRGYLGQVFFVNTTERMRIDSSGDVLIGSTSNNGEKLRVQDNATTGTSCQLSIISGNAERGILNFGDAEDHNIGRISYHHSDNAMFFHTNNTERLRIDSSGNVGIGEASPSSNLVVKQSGSTFTTQTQTVALFQRSSTTGHGAKIAIVSGNAASSDINFGDTDDEDVGLIQYVHTDNSFRFKTNTAEQMRIDSSGRVGIGTASPSTKLHISDASAPELRIVDTTNNCTGFMRPVDTSVRIGTGSNHPLEFHVNLSERVRIDTSGRVGIRTTSPGGMLHVKTPAGVSGNENTVKGVVIQEDSFSSANLLELQNSVGGGLSAFDQAGQLGIGTTSPSEKLEVGEVSGAVTSGDLLVKTDSTSAEVIVGRLSTTSNDNTTFKVRDRVDRDVLSVGTSSFIYSQAGAERLRINSAGRVGIGNSSPGNKLSVSNAGAESFDVNPGSVANNNIILHYNWSGSNYVTAETRAAQHVFEIGTSEKMRIDGAGRLLVGTTTEGHANADNLTVADSGDGGITIRTGTSHNGRIYFSDGTSGTAEYAGAIDYDHATNKLAFFTNSAERMTVENTGQVSIAHGSSGAPNLFLNATDSAFSTNVQQNRVTRAANSGFVFLSCRTIGGGDIEFNLRGDGYAYADGSWNGGGADYAEFFEWSDGNTSDEDRRGISVVLDGDKIREATSGEEPIGVISGNPSVVGDADIERWKGKYLRDEYGTYDLDENGDRKLNPDFDPDAEYVSRENRAEWDCVGLMGKLRIRKGQVTGSRWIKMRDVSDTVEEWLVR